MKIDKIERVVGGTNLSIGTHLALESLFFNSVDIYDEDREFEELNPSDYSLHMFNIFTLLRNILGSIELNDKFKCFEDPDTLTRYLVEEVQTLVYLYKELNMECMVYYPTYDKALRSLNFGKDPMEVRGWKMYLQMREYLKNLFKKQEFLPMVVKTSHRFPERKETKEIRPFLVTTHYGIDLLNRGNFCLLESHTGALITRDKFGKKYHSIGETDLSDYPWLPELYYLLGDTQLVKPLALKFRKRIAEIAISKKWTHKTTASKVKYDVNIDNLLKGVINGYKPVY